MTNSELKIRVQWDTLLICLRNALDSAVDGTDFGPQDAATLRTMAEEVEFLVKNSADQAARREVADQRDDFHAELLKAGMGRLIRMPERIQ